ncbi:hypothetical protein [Wielerella bovis]|nr:hypothetical protein [Wielerella bovis]MCG7657954.1 hypothetical protein [Wielerella bovis]MCG7660176.1 hypothetical protein [Wielerella bovis]
MVFVGEISSLKNIKTVFSGCMNHYYDKLYRVMRFQAAFQYTIQTP